MAKKDDLKAKLTELGISFDEDAKVSDLEALLPEGSDNTDENGFIVEDPEILRPRELPLVVKLPEGQNWKNEAQAEYVKFLNGYAYKNPKKWAEKKNDSTRVVEGKSVQVKGLLTKLKEIGDNPTLFNFYAGIQEVDTKLAYTNKLLEK